MHSSSFTSWAAFVLAVAALNGVPAGAAELSPANPGNSLANPVESRISRIQANLKAKASQLPNSETYLGGTGQGEGESIAGGGFGNARGGGGFGNATGGGGFGNARGGGGFVNTAGSGGFANVNPWRNAWGDGGGFVNW